MSKYFKISDFAQQIGKHQNTIDGWFKKLDEQRIHFVVRIDNEKVYDESDLEIALFIRDKREEGWSLKAIFNELEDRFNLRPFPEQFEEKNMPMDLEVVRRKFSEDMQMIIQEAVRAQVEVAVGQVKDHYEGIIQQLPKAEDIIRQLPRPKDPLEERQERITELITIERVKAKLRKEALHMWSTKPESERMRKVGWFKKEEDHSARDLFVQNYVDDHLGDRLQKEYGIDKV